MAYFASSGSGPGILGESIAAAMNVNAMLWRTAPATTELEQVTLDWLRQMVGLPQPVFGVINDTASSSTLYALAAAREAQTDLRIRELGMSGRPELPRLRYYASSEAHSSVEKAGVVARHRTRWAAQDPGRRALSHGSGCAASGDPRGCRCRNGGRSPSWPPRGRHRPRASTPCRRSPASASSTACGCTSMRRTVAAAAIAPEYRWVLDGAEHADFIVVNPHKWLFTPIDCSVLWTRRPEVLRGAFSIVPEYLTTADGAEQDAPNLMDYGTSLGRRMRALKLWMVIRHFGTAGLAARIREHCDFAATSGVVGGERARLRATRAGAVERRVSARASTRT